MTVIFLGAGAALGPHGAQTSGVSKRLLQTGAVTTPHGLSRAASHEDGPPGAAHATSFLVPAGPLAVLLQGAE